MSVSLRPGNTAHFKEMLQGLQAIGNTAVSDLTGPRFEPQTSRSRDKRVNAQPTGWSLLLVVLNFVFLKVC